MPVVSIRHRTVYRYRNPVAFGEHRMMFRPLEGFDQRLLSAEVEIWPEPALFRHVHDVGGTSVGVARFDRPSDRLTFESRVVLEHTPQLGFELETEAALGADGVAYEPHELPELSRSMVRTGDAAVEAWARGFVRPAGRTHVSRAMSDMAHAIHDGFAYRLRLEGAPQSPAETLASRAGSCRDFAVLMMAAARSLGVAARFVSGYVYSASPKARQGGGHTHAWMRAYLPGCGWTDFDPTNGIIGNTDLVRVAVAVDPREALPLHGTWAGLPGDYLGMEVDVDVAVRASENVQPPELLRVAQAG